MYKQADESLSIEKDINFHSYTEWMKGNVTRQISRAHSFLRKILPNSAGQFAKFRGSRWPSVCG